MDCIVEHLEPLALAPNTSAVSICVPPSALGAATRAALCVPVLMALQLVLPCPCPGELRQGPVVGVCFSCSDLIRVPPETHEGTAVSCRPSCCPLVCCLDKGWRGGSCSHQFRVCELGHAQVELSSSLVHAGGGERGRAPPAFCMGIFLHTTSVRTLSLLSSSEWILNPLERAWSSLLPKSYTLCLVFPWGTLFMPAKAQNQSHVLFKEKCFTLRRMDLLQGTWSQSPGPAKWRD